MGEEIFARLRTVLGLRFAVRGVEQFGSYLAMKRSAADPGDDPDEWRADIAGHFDFDDEVASTRAAVCTFDAGGFDAPVRTLEEVRWR